jgi:hypothetical protein
VKPETFHTVFVIEEKWPGSAENTRIYGPFRLRWNIPVSTADPQLRIANLERELNWAHLKIRVLEERLRQHRIRLLGPPSETLSDLQLELLADEEPGVTGEEVEAEAARAADYQAAAGAQSTSGPGAIAGESGARGRSDSLRGAELQRVWP